MTKDERVYKVFCAMLARMDLRFVDFRYYQSIAEEALKVSNMIDSLIEVNEVFDNKENKDKENDN